MKIQPIVVGMLSTNCYLTFDEETKKALIIDPGADSKKIREAITALGLIPEKIIITHGHLDHISAAVKLQETYGVPLMIHEQELEYMVSDEIRRSPYSEKTFTRFIEAAGTVGEFVQQGDQVELLGSAWNVIEVPGHTAHSICLYNAENQVVFTGDTLFAGGVGRTDFYAGPGSDLMMYLKERILTLPEATLVLPGHGGYSTIGQEIQHNPFL